MMKPESNPLDDQFARHLAAHAEQLLTGRSKPDEAISPELAPRLNQAQAFVELLDGVWRRQRAVEETPAEHDQTEHGPTAPEHPANVGRFQVIRELGRGGGGVVYLAHDPALGRHVALKVPRLEVIMTPTLRRRFLREGQAAALLNHPNIVSIHEAGNLGSVCYIVSAYCPGPTLAQWLRDRPEPVTAQDAALLVQRLAEAMTHAHERGILHRDLKPSNVLLHMENQTSAPKSNSLNLQAVIPMIADFGLAKVLLDAEDATGTGVLLGTTAYMAPEQTRGAKDLGAACDLWALGVILYEVLTRRKAFRGGTTVEVMQSIQTEEPVAPRRLRPRLPRDLETICLKCLEKNPRKRYPSAGALAEDLSRFLRDEPIQARSTGRLERLVKWARRRPGRAALVVSTCVIVAFLVVGGIYYKAEDSRREQQRAALEHAVTKDLEEAQLWQRQEQWAEAARVLEGAKGRLQQQDLAALQAHVESRRREVELVAHLQKARLKASLTLPGLGDREGDRLFGEAFADQGLSVDSADVEKTARQIRASAIRHQLVAALDDWAFMKDSLQAGTGEPLRAIVRLADDDPWRQQVRNHWMAKNRDALMHLAERDDVLAQPPLNVKLLSELLNRGPPLERAAMKRVLETRMQLLRRAQLRYPADLWINYQLAKDLALGALASETGSPEAVGFLRAALAVQPKSSELYLTLATLLWNQQNLPEAERAYRRAIELQADFTEAHEELGHVLREQRKFTEAEAAYGKTIELRAKDTNAYNNLGNVLIDQRKLPEAVTAYSKAVELGPTNAQAHYNLGNALSDQGHFPAAEAAYRQALALNPAYHDAHHNLGAALKQQQKPVEAEAAFRKAIELILERQQKTSEKLTKIRRDLQAAVALSFNGLGAALYDQKKLPEAESACRKAIEFKGDLAEAHANLGNALEYQDKLVEAEGAYRKAAELKPGYAEACYNLGCILYKQEKLADAAAAWRKTVEIDPDHAWAHWNLGVALLHEGQFTDSLASLRKGHELGHRRPDQFVATDNLLRKAEEYVVLDAKLPKIMSGETHPADAAERIALAGLCQLPCRQFYATSARFYREAYTAESKLAEAFPSGGRYDAACAAALAGSGQGKDAAKVEAMERVSHREQALTWLRADLAVWRSRLEKEPNKDRAIVLRQMRHWQRDPDFGEVRGEPALAKLPEGERRRWEELWHEVQELEHRAAESSGKL